MRKLSGAWQSRLKRTLAMFLVVVSLMGIVPLEGFELFDLTTTAEAAGAYAGSFADTAGTHTTSTPGKYTVNATAMTFTRYTLVHFPNEANHPDNYEVVGQLNITNSSKTKAAAHGGGPISKTASDVLRDAKEESNPDILWLGQDLGAYSGLVPGNGNRGTCALDYQQGKVKQSGLWVYGAPSGFNFVTEETFNTWVTKLLPKLAEQDHVALDSEEGQKNYTPDGKKLISRFADDLSPDAHIKQFGPEIDKMTGNAAGRQIYESGPLFNALVACLSIGRWAGGSGTKDSDIEAWFSSGHIMNYQDFVNEDGQNMADGKCNGGYRILVEPGSVMKVGSKYYFGTARDFMFLGLCEDKPGQDWKVQIAGNNWNNLRKAVFGVTNQAINEFTVYDPQVLKDKLAETNDIGDSMTAAILDRGDPTNLSGDNEQHPVFQGLSQEHVSFYAADTCSSFGMRTAWACLFPKYTPTHYAKGSVGSFKENGSYGLSIISPYNFRPKFVGFGIRKETNIGDISSWEFTVKFTSGEGGSPIPDGEYGAGNFVSGGEITVTVNSNDQVTFDNLPEDAYATVTEVIPSNAPDDMTTYINGEAATDPAAPLWSGPCEGTGTVNFKNTTEKPQDIIIEKTVSGEGDKNKEWQFDVTFSDTVDGKYTIDGGSETSFNDSKLSFKLKHGQKCRISGLLASTTYKVVEKEANQDGYTTDPSSGSVEGDPVNNPNAKFVNTKGKPGDDDDDDDIIYKTDAVTGKRVGVAWFTIEGQSDDGRRIETTRPTNAEGVLHAQWSDKNKPDYIPPGKYKVTEYQAPLGYQLSTESQYIVLGPGGKDHTGPLTFKNPPTTTIEFKKVSFDGDPVEGATFNVKHDGKYEGTATTGPDGTFQWQGKPGHGLESGTYEFEEIEAPAGYMIPKDNKRTIVVDLDDRSTPQVIKVQMEDPYDTKIIPYKTSTEGGPLAGAYFEIMVDGTVLGEFGPTGDDGKIPISSNMLSAVKRDPDDSWTVSIRETKAPPGYMIGDRNWKNIEVNGRTKEVVVPFTDPPYPDIIIRKYDINDPTKNLDGGVFEVFIDDQSIGTFTTGEDGDAGFIKITYEEYGRFLKEDATGDKLFDVKVVEITAPKGYIIDDPNWQTKPLMAGQKQLDFEFADTPYPEIWVRKLDSETGERLADMEFSVEIDGINIGTFRTTDEDVKNNDGWYKITYEDLKEFLGTHGGDKLDLRGYTVTVTEMSPPQFYNYDIQEGPGANGHSYTKQLQSNQDHLTFEFENTHYRSIKVHKADQEKGWPLKNAEFTLTLVELDDKSLNFSAITGWGGVSKQMKTNSEGWCVFENLPNGWYELTESMAPPGYLGNDTTGVTDENKGHWTDTGKSGPRRIHITSGSGADGSEEAPNAKNRFLEFTYVNPTPVGVHIFKRDGLTGEPIKGVKFVIKSVPPLDPYEETFETDDNGMIVIEDQAYGGLKPGTYEVTETYVPKPYNLPKDGSNTQLLKIDDPGRHQSYSLTFNNYPDMYVYAVKRDSKTGLPVPGAKFELTEVGGGRVGDIVTSGENGFAMLGPVEPGKSYTITEVAAPDGYELTNPNYQNFKVPDVTSNWSAEFEFSDNPLCNLWLRKVDATNFNKGLQGAEFRIEKAGGGIVKQNAVTDNEGYINVKGLEPGDYVAIEITAPNGYMLPEGKDAETRIHLESGKTETILIKNYKPGGLQIRKVDAKTGEALTGAEFQLYDAYEKPIGGPVKVGSDGFARWADLEPGVYFVEETKAPEGYAKTEGKKRFEVVGFESVTYEWPNAEEATITIYKRDGNTELPLAGAEFEVRDLNGAVVDKLVTNRNGTATSKKLPLGYYQIVETKAPAGYQIAEEKSQPIEVKAGSPVVIDRYNWSDKTIIIRKRDVNTQQPLQGAWFELQTIDGEILQDAICTDASGVAVTKQVEPGQYYLVETKAPDGYKIIKEKILVTVEAGKGVSVDVDNMPTTIVQIYKTDSVSGDPIPNTEFALKDKHGKVLEVLMTDISGWAYSQPLPAGDYVVEETQAAPGYIKDTEVHHVELEEGKNFTLMLKNTPGIHITVFKVDGTDTNSEGSSTGGEGAASRKPLPGAVFELETDSTTGDCKYIGTYTTDEYGKFEVEGLAPGFYRLHEKTPPDGYAVVDEYTRICVKAGELNIFYVENVKLATLIVRKLDVADGKPVAGAVFELKTADGKTLGRKETDSNGEAIWTNLLAGHYTVTEAIQPDSYDLTGCPTRSVTVSYGIDNVIEFKDEAYGSLVIILQDKHTGAYLEGGQFVVTNLTNMNIVFDSKTDVTGTLVVGNLAPGWYEIVQKYSPDGYTIIESTQKVEIKLGLQQTIYYVNETAGLVIEKVDSKDTSKTLEGARFKVTRVEDNNVIGEYVTDKSGVALLSNLKPGYYKVEEVAAPLGYEIDDPRPQQVDIHGGKTAHVTFMDTARASITINVVDKATQQGLAGCKVEVWVQNGDKVNEWTSDKTGMIETEKMTPGYYVLKLVKVTDGYKAVLSETTVELKAGIECNFKFECTKSGSVIVAGKDENGNLLAGVKFQLVSIDGTVIGTYVTNSDGTYDLSGIAPGEYVIKWLAGPSGYEVITNVQNITITAGGSVNIDITHKLLSDITIQVNDSGTKTGLANCKIEIWREHGDLVQTIVTDNSGTIKTDKLDNGNYVVKLITWPDGYTPVKTEQTITVTYNRSITVQFDCVNSGSLTVSGFDPDGKALAGVKFEIRDLTGKVIGSYETGSDGKYVVSGLAAGFYEVIEISCPDGMSKIESSTTQRVEIKSGSSASVEFKHVADSDVTISVKDQDRKPISGVTIEIWQQNGDKIQTLVTDATGIVITNKLTAGVYVIKALDVPDGYVLTQSEQVITITANRHITVDFTCSANGGLTVSSTDEKGQLMAGVGFDVKLVSGELIGHYVTNANGTYTINNLKPGRYEITWTSSPDGYNPDESTKVTQVEITSGNSIEITLKHVRQFVINIGVIDKNTLAGLNGAVIEIWQQNGSLVNTFTTDSTGKISVGTLPNGFYVVKLIKLIDGYKAELTETVIEVKTGVEINFNFECVSNGGLTVISKDSAGQAIAGMFFSVTDINGTPVGSYTTGTDGRFILADLVPGWYIVTATKAPEGFNLPSETSQKIEVKAGGSSEVIFQHTKIFGLQIRTTVQQTGVAIGGAVYKVTTLQGLEVCRITSNDAGIGFYALEPGWYVVTPETAPKGYQFADMTPRNVEVKADGLTAIDFLVTQQSSMRIKVIDGTTGAGIYNVRIQLKNSAGVCIKEYYTNDQGIIYLDQVITAGGYVVEMISAPAGYIIDKMPHSLDAENGATTEITYKLYKEGGQIQVVVTSAEYNKTLDLPAGTPLQGAVFEITNPDTFQVVGKMISDASGIAASSALPIGRYTVKMVTAPAYYGINESFNPEVRLKINNDVVRVETTVKSVNLKTVLTQKTNQTAKAGSTIRVDVLAANNASDARLNNFFLHIKVPTDAARIVSINPGTWNAEVFYTISYKTNANDYRKVGQNLSSGNNYTFDLSTQSLGLMPGEYVTDVRFEFGTVPAGFAVKTKTTYGLYIQGVPNGYKMLTRAELGGQHGATSVSTNHVTQPEGLNSPLGGGQPVVSGQSDTWKTATSILTTTITNTGKLPKTGY